MLPKCEISGLDGLGGAISWSNKKQALVASSTSKAEYIALSAAAQEAAWL